ncbi:divergent polysaccharide deacetylase family protein [Marinobacter sp. C2H3]|uniref:divergent polysaccharide deacetylase family protein n=1 Tax=Marinobacter sp. C2H3 TaxID=3119003 RepID=UPI00300F307C
MRLRHVLTALGVAAFGALASGPVSAQRAPSGTPPTIAIIIDDMGFDATQGERLARMEQPLTLAFLPFRPHTVALARLAHEHGKEIMLHAPMANTHHYELGAGGLTPDMDQHTMTTVLRRSLQAIPYVAGVNNHMGSLLTQQLKPMDWVMAELEKYPLYFVDSRTIATTVAGKVASAYRVPSIDRDVFLDNEQTDAAIDVQFKRLIQLARKNGSAVAIGHPHKATVDYLTKHLPELDEQGIAVATVSGLWALRNDNRSMFVDGSKQPVQPAYARKQ